MFFSRSRQRLWEKGETSGHTLLLSEIYTDCDRDSLLVLARPEGPTCHLGKASCFGEIPSRFEQPLAFLSVLEDLIEQRITERPSDSYTVRLIDGGITRVAQKVGEEALEAALAGAAGSNEEVVAESADLLYHLLVLLRARWVCRWSPWSRSYARDMPEPRAQCESAITRDFLLSVFKRHGSVRTHRSRYIEGVGGLGTRLP